MHCVVKAVSALLLSCALVLLFSCSLALLFYCSLALCSLALLLSCSGYALSLVITAPMPQRYDDGVTTVSCDVVHYQRLVVRHR